MKTGNKKICKSTDCIANISGECVADKCQGVLARGWGVFICFDMPNRLTPEDAAAIYGIGMRHLKENLENNKGDDCSEK